MTTVPRLSLLLAAFLFLAGCSGGKASTTPDDPDAGTNTPQINLADYEDFEPGLYPDQQPPAPVALTHDVPDRLMEGRANRGVVQTVRGYRVQIFNSIDRASAIQQEEGAKTWWQSLQQYERPQGLFSDTLPVYTLYRQPYYQIRLGDFATRSEAEAALSFIKRRYADAFVAPDMVTIVR